MENGKWKIGVGRHLARSRVCVRSRPAFLVLCILFASGIAGAQQLPAKIRGYKVYQAKIVVKTQDQRPEDPKDELKKNAFITVGEPKLIKVSLVGITFELTAAIDSIEHSGKVDFLSFHDFRVNGRSVDLEDYEESFDFKKNKTISLPKPVPVFVSIPQGVLGALGEARDSKERWRVTGRVFVFGRFKKAGFRFKRVVPVDIDILIANPVRSGAVI